MRILSPRRGIVVRVALAFCLLSFPLAGWQQTTDSADDDDDSGPPQASVTLHPRLRGDVDITIYLTGVHKPIDLAAVLRSSLKCDWHGTATGADYVSGTCRHLLRSERGAVEDKLVL